MKLTVVISVNWLGLLFTNVAIKYCVGSCNSRGESSFSPRYPVMKVCELATLSSKAVGGGMGVDCRCHLPYRNATLPPPPTTPLQTPRRSSIEMLPFLTPTSFTRSFNHNECYNISNNSNHHIFSMFIYLFLKFVGYCFILIWIFLQIGKHHVSLSVGFCSVGVNQEKTDTFTYKLTTQHI